MSSSTDYLEYYRQNMMGVGEMVYYFENGEKHTARIEGIGDLGELLVIEGNIHKSLYSGEITVAPASEDDALYEKQQSPDFSAAGKFY